jgi:hypothetical protein
MPWHINFQNWKRFVNRTTCSHRACAKGRMSRKALELLQDAKDNNMPLDAFIYTATIDGKDKPH